jgi:hypothetical protein
MNAPERFIHYSDKPLLRVKNSSQEDVQLEARGAKPHGLWFSVGDAWRTYIQARRWDTRALRCETEIALTDDAKRWHVRNVVELDALTAEYSKISDRTKTLQSSKARLPLIDWPRFALDFDAIIIAPFISDRHLQDHWYHSWDVASGCVWNACAVRAAHPINY